VPDIPTRNVETLPLRKSLAHGFWFLELKLPEVVCVWLLLIKGFDKQRQTPELALRPPFFLLSEYSLSY